MAGKCNSRSFRYSDKVGEVLAQQEGASLNDKFEKLVLLCFDMVPKRKKELRSLEKQIQAKREEYRRECSKLSELESLLRTLEQLKRYGDLCEDHGGKVREQLEGIGVL